MLQVDFNLKKYYFLTTQVAYTISSVNGIIKEEEKHLMSEKPSKNKTAIMKAIEKIVTTDGYGSVSMSRVAQETGLSPATAYNYFANKHDMIATTYHDACERFNKFLISHVKTTGAPDAQLAAYMQAVYDFGIEEPTTFLFTNSIFNSPINQEMSESKHWTNSIMEPWVKLAQQGIDQGYFRQMDPLAMIYLAYHVVSNMVVDFYQKNLTEDSLSIEEIIIIVLQGLRKPK